MSKPELSRTRGPRSDWQSKTANYNITAYDRGGTIIATGSNSWTLGTLAAATAGNGFQVFFKNAGTGVITLDPNSAETVDGLTTKGIYPGESCIIATDGTSWNTFGLSAGWVPIRKIDVTNQSSVVVANLEAFRTLRFVGTLLSIGTELIRLQVSQDNGANWIAGTSYNFNSIIGTDGSITGSLITGSSGIFVGTSTNSDLAKASVEFSIFDLNQALYTKEQATFNYRTTTPTNITRISGGYVNSNVAHNAIRLIADSGNITVNGLLEGLRG